MLVDFIYLTLMNVFSENHASEADSNSKKVIQVIIHIQLYFQNISLLWHPNLKLSHWGTYQGFWSILSYPSLDSLLADLDLLPIYLLVAVSALSAIVVLLLICSLLVHYDKPLPALVLKPLKFLFFIFSHLYFIPTTIVLAILLKYTNSSTVLVEEYSYHVVAKDFYYGNTGLIIGICLLALHLAIAAIYECCSFEIRHSLMNIDITAKSTAKVDIMIKFLSFTRCLLYVAIAEFSYSTYIFVIAVTYAIGGGFLVCYIPNYSTFMNLLKAGIQIGSFFGALIFIVAYALADAEVAIVLMVFIQPSLIILINFGIQYRVSKIVPLQYCVTRNFLMFEISARESLASGTQERTILKSLNQNFKLTKNKSNFVMQAYYCSDILNDHMLALVKIFRVNHYDFSFLTNFQIFKCKEALQNYCIKSSDGFKMYSYLAKFRKNKSNHEDLCEEMLMLYEKILDKDVSLTTLKSCLNKFDESVELVKKQSLELLKLNPDSLVMLEMYGTLLSEVLGDSESAKVYLDKKTRANPALNRKKAMICMDESSCLMIVSGDKKKIGKILWANENMIRLLGSSEESMQESYLSHFIPKPFNVNHDIRLWKFVENCVSHHIFRSLPLFLANQDGFLVECYFNSECIGFEGEINFLSLIEPITGKNREVALISREGLIHSHSQNLPKLCKSPDKYIQGRALSEFLPNLDLTKLPVNTLCIMDNFGVEIAMVIKEKTIGSTLFHTIYISNDKSEISRWKNKDVKVDDFGAKIHLTLFKVNEGKASENEVRMNSSKKRSLEKKETVKMPENVLEEKKGITHTSSSKEINKLEMKLLQKAESKLNYMKFLVLLSVIFTQVIVIVVYNIAILVYINDEVSKATSLNTLNNLGELAYSISQISLISRFLDFNKNNPSFTIFTLNDLELKVNQTRTLNDELRNNPNEFQMCGYSYLLDENKMAYWEYTSQNHAQYGNLNDIISLILAKTSAFILKYQDGLDYSDELFFLVFNGIGGTFSESKSVLKGLYQCEVQQAVELDMVRIYLMIGAGVILGLILIAISFYAISIDKTLNALWETLRKKVHSSYYKIKTTLIERLIQYHNRTDLEEISDFNVRKSSAPIKFWHSVRYLLKLSVFFASAALFYALASAYFFMKIYKSLCIRPLLMYTVMIRRISMTELSYFMFENELLKTPQSLNALYPEFNIFTSPTLLYDQAYEYFKGANKVLALSESRSHLSNSFFTILFEKIDGFDNFLAFGTFSAYEYLCFESLNIIQNNAFDNIDTIKKFMSEKIQLETNVKSVFNLLESDTKAKIYSDLNSFIYFVVACCLFLILLYLVYYLPYLNSEKKILQRLMKNIAIVPLSNL